MNLTGRKTQELDARGTSQENETRVRRGQPNFSINETRSVRKWQCIAYVPGQSRQVNDLVILVSTLSLKINRTW